jgi:hypothetical protein
MTVTLAFGLFVQALAVTALRYCLGPHWLRHPVALLILVSVVYQGVAPLLLIIPSVATWDIYRTGVQQGYTDSGTLLMSAGMLALTAAYLLTRPERAGNPPGEDDAAFAARVLDWRLLTLACIPLAVLTYEGRGYNGLAETGGGAATSTELASTFFTLLVVLAAFGLVLRHGSGWFLPTLIAQSALLAAAGERLPVIVDAIALVVLLARVGMRPSTRQLNGGLGLTLLGVLAITGVRAEQGRSLYYQDSGFGARLTALGNGLLAGTSPGSSAKPGLVAQAVVRLDGTSFAGAILQAQATGQPRLSASYVPKSLLLAVPSAAWPSKLAHGNALNPALLAIDNFGLQRVNFLPGLPGLYTGFLSPAWLIIFLASLGLVAGWAERWLLRSCSPARLVLLAGAVTAALWFEKGLPGMAVFLRTALVLAAAVKIIEVARRPKRSQHTVPVCVPVVSTSRLR